MLCTIESIKAILSSDYFEGHKVPPDNQLEIQANVIADEILGVVTMYGYEKPAENTDFYKYLASTNVMGVAAIVAKRLFPMQSQNKNEFQDKYDKMLQRIIDHSWISYYTDTTVEDDRQW